MSRSDTQVRLALPSKGRMEEETIQMLADCGLRVNKTNPRQYSATIPVLPQVHVLFQRARDVARSVASGAIDLGITGYDTVVDGLDSDMQEVVIVHEAMGYGNCALVVAVPEEWEEINSLADLRRRADERGGLRAATKHVNIARRFFSQQGLGAIKVVSADGALEAAPTIGYADFIVDITSTGTTLSENHLKSLEDGTLLDSEAVFIANRKALIKRAEVLAAAREILEFVEAHLRARGQYLVIANIRGENPEVVAGRIFSQGDLGGLQGPTIAKVVGRDGGDWWSVSMVIPSSRLYEAINQLRSIGGSGVIVTPALYIFEEYPPRYRRLLEEIGKQEVTRP